MSGIAIITGVSRGIGECSARAFLDRGWSVIGLSRRAPRIEGVQHLPVDLLEPDWSTRVAPWLDTQLGKTPRLICLLHNAACMYKDDALTGDPTRFREVLELNVVAPVQLNALVHPHQGPGSSILYIGSTLSEKAVAGTASYVTSKHALAGLMKATCQDLKGTGVHTACICPGFTATEMLLGHLGDDPAVRAAVEGASTMGRLIEPEEIAATVLFCAENPVINGAVLHASLGQVEH